MVTSSSVSCILQSLLHVTQGSFLTRLPSSDPASRSLLSPSCARLACVAKRRLSGASSSPDISKQRGQPSRRHPEARPGYSDDRRHPAGRILNRGGNADTALFEFLVAYRCFQTPHAFQVGP